MFKIRRGSTLIFTLILVFLCQNFAYSSEERFCLRIPLTIEKNRYENATKIITDEEYSKGLSDLVHDLNTKATAMQGLCELLIRYLNSIYKENIASRIEVILTKVKYPNEDELLYKRALAYTGEHKFYIKETLKKVEFYKGLFNETSNFTLLTREEIGGFTEEQIKEIKEHIDELKSNAKRASELIDKFEFRTVAGRQIKVINLYEWSEANLKDTLKCYIGKIRAEVDIAPDLLLLADEYDLEQMFYNLITNSIRAIVKLHGADETEYGEIKITARRDNGKIIIEVKDNGIGLNSLEIIKIAKEKGGLDKEVISSMKEPAILALIFEPWFTTRKGGGRGLDIVRRNVRRYDGDINVQSELGKGTTFTITLSTAEQSQTLTSGQGVEWDSAWGEPTEEAMNIAKAYLDAWSKLSVEELTDIFIQLCRFPFRAPPPGQMSPCILFFDALKHGLGGIKKINLDLPVSHEKVPDIYKAMCRINPDWAAYMFLDMPHFLHLQMDYVLARDYDKGYVIKAINRAIEIFRESDGEKKIKARCFNKDFLIRIDLEQFISVVIERCLLINKSYVNSIGEENLAFIIEEYSKDIPDDERQKTIFLNALEQRPRVKQLIGKEACSWLGLHGQSTKAPDSAAEKLKHIARSSDL